MSANRVRIIGGRYRSRILRFPPSTGLRPTPDRVRETLFNWLGQDLTGHRCLDLFAGSGALGFEAVSRGAELVVLVESNRAAFRALERNAAALGCEAFVELHHADALEFLHDTDRTFDVVFLDPPFGSEMLARVAGELRRITAPGGGVYVESSVGIELARPFRLHRQGRAGHVTYQLFRHGDQ